MQNDPSPRNKSARKSNISNLNEDNTANKSTFDETKDDVEIDNDDDDETDSSFILVYQILFERSVNIFLNQTENYMLYEVELTPLLVFFLSLITYI